MRQIKDSEVRRVCSTRITENTHKILVIKHEGEHHVGKFCVDGMIIEFRKYVLTV
jgi:hypothetical protein